MDYESMAEELLAIRAKLLHVPADQRMNAFVRGEMFVLNYLLDHGGSVYPKDLGKEMEVSSARIAALLNQMEKKRWILRNADSEDYRQTLITLTDAGREEIMIRRAELMEAVVKMLQRIGPEDAKEYLRIQRKIMET